MKFPLVARSTLEAVQSERDFLRSELSASREHARRVERAESGLPELPVQARKEAEVLPNDILEACMAWEDRGLQKHQETEAWRLYKTTRNWNAVRKEIGIEPIS